MNVIMCIGVTFSSSSGKKVMQLESDTTIILDNLNQKCKHASCISQPYLAIYPLGGLN